MTTFNNDGFVIKFIGSGKERILSNMEVSEAKDFLEHVGRVKYGDSFICAAFWDSTSNELEISHTNEASVYFKSVIEQLLK